MVTNTIMHIKGSNDLLSI